MGYKENFNQAATLPDFCSPSLRGTYLFDDLTLSHPVQAIGRLIPRFWVEFSTSLI